MLKERVRLTERDILCLKFIVEQGYATINQLWRIAWANQKSEAYVYGRILILERSGFLKSIKIDGFTFKIVSMTSKTRAAIASITSAPIAIRVPPRNQVQHQLNINELRIVLGQLETVSVYSSLCLTSFFHNRIYAPDLILELAHLKKVAIVYDRTLRKKDRIFNKITFYTSEIDIPARRFDVVLYLVSQGFLNTYRHIFEQKFNLYAGVVKLISYEDFHLSISGNAQANEVIEEYFK